ncbi:MAG: flagellin [Euryarchaeota archaeon]|nr:flagellin [Euryarchaeota archaeon]
MKKVWNKKEKGEMGIGTLIIFIAMIIVAAVAATVLIQTAYQLQQQAEETGNIAIQDVATGFKIIHMGGQVNLATNPPALSTVEIKVGLLAGSPAIDMKNVLIEITDGSKDVTLTFTTNWTLVNTTGSTYFTAVLLRDMPPQNWNTQYVMTQGDVVKLVINATAVGLNLTPQSQVTLQIIPKHGVPTYAAFMVPATLTTKYVDLY